MPTKKTVATPVSDDILEDFDFKPITSGLGFHHQKPEVKPVQSSQPVYAERIHIPAAPITAPKKEMNVYQNDLSMFYGQTMEAPQMPIPEETMEVVVRSASKGQRVLAYVLDLSFVVGTLSLVLTAMAKATDLDLMEIWETYPHEMTPLAITLFCGFYFIYFSVFEKSASSTIGKNLLGIRVVDLQNKNPSFFTLMIRSLVSMASFISLGLFAWFDLQNKVTSTKVIRID